MKIKQKKHFNLSQLIEWAWKNEVTSSVFWTSNREEGFQNNVRFDIEGILHTSDNFNFYDTFTVEVEETVTEDTVIPKLIELYSNEAKNTFVEHHRDRTIKQIQDEGGCKSLVFYILNDDYTMTLIWRDGRLIE